MVGEVRFVVTEVFSIYYAVALLACYAAVQRYFGVRKGEPLLFTETNAQVLVILFVEIVQEISQVAYTGILFTEKGYFGCSKSYKPFHRAGYLSFLPVSSNIL